MLFPILVAVLVAAIIVSGVVLVQAFVTNVQDTEAARMRAIAELAKARGGTVTPISVADHLGLTPMEADHLLRQMVDDDLVTMSVDDAEGVLRFQFVKLVDARRASTVNR